LARAALLTAAVGFATAGCRGEIPAEPKAYTLFMGADISVGLNQQLYPVEDVSGSSWVIRVKKKAVTVSSRNGPVDLKISPRLKLTSSSALVADLKGERAYTPLNDPNINFAKAAGNSENMSQGFQTNINNVATGYARTQGGTLGAEAAAARMGPTMQLELVAEGGAAGSNVDAPGDSPGLKNLELYDAMEVTFGLSAEKRLEKPFVVIITQYREKLAQPRVVHNWVYAESLNPVSSASRTVHILEGGFPPGFELIDFQLHLYDAGREVATNVAPKRVGLTREEAFEYLKIEYVSDHRNATLPPVPALGHLPGDLKARIASGQISDTLFVRVSKDGLAAGVYYDEACTQKVRDEYLSQIARDLRFEPALADGKPVEGATALKLGQLTF
jgi:hypothetical protein